MLIAQPPHVYLGWSPGALLWDHPYICGQLKFDCFMNRDTIHDIYVDRPPKYDMLWVVTCGFVVGPSVRLGIIAIWLLYEQGHGPRHLG